MNRLRIATAMLLLALGACGSTPESAYYRLSGSATGGSGDGPAVGIGPVEIPEYLNRNSMLFNYNDNALHVASYQRWAEPLGDGITRVVGLNLARSLDTQNIRTFPWPPLDRPDYSVQIWLLVLDASTEHTRLVAEWRLWQPGSKREVMRRISRYEEDGIDFDGGALAAATSRMLLQLSEDIAASIRADQSAP